MSIILCTNVHFMNVNGYTLKQLQFSGQNVYVASLPVDIYWITQVLGIEMCQSSINKGAQLGLCYNRIVISLQY